MKILFIAAEALPWAKVGGLADVVGSLPQTLARLGHDVRLVIPKYGNIDVRQHGIRMLKDKLKVSIMGETRVANLRFTDSGRVPTYMVENDYYFGGEEVYGENDLERFLFFSRVVFEMLPQMDWQPEIVHCHDWHTSPVIMWMKKAHLPYASVLTIHNLAYQGAFDNTFLNKAGLEEFWEHYPTEAPEPPLNFLSQGILWADLVTTVSRTYAQEILTTEYGNGLESLLRYRQKDLLWIVNGIDHQEYNPATDPFIEANYNSESIGKRDLNKLALQQRANLPQNLNIPLIGMVQRLDEQKGFDILAEAADCFLTETEAQLVILGKGRDCYESLLQQIAVRYPQQMSVFITRDNPLAHLIYAGCDLFLMPSHFEPCGIGQLIAMRYGALPIVRHTGGLVDTVPEFTADLKKGNGFVFREYTPDALIAAVKQGIAAFENRVAWGEAMRRVMQLDFSWRASAAKYESIYRQLLDRKGRSTAESRSRLQPKKQ
ncbi:MAG: glycogen synthase [Chloroflexi bacterium]|nr:glycogen synthase [Chloroflexota bacterium]